jgi:hypothetical protein
MNHFWYAVPLIASVSLVYAATRHELMPHILRHAARVAAWITVFLVVVYLILWLMLRQV